jgi:hypothetical protein
VDGGTDKSRDGGCLMVLPCRRRGRSSGIQRCGQCGLPNTQSSQFLLEKIL